MSNPKILVDNHNRRINYVRLSVTDRCNLRCFYCMPAEGIQFVNRSDLLTYEEMIRLSIILADHGVNKFRITGGEPFVRKDLIHFLKNLGEINGVENVSITTNGILTKKYIHELKQIGISNINLSLDTFDRKKFQEITRRDEFENVRSTLFSLIESGLNVKINCVVMNGVNSDDIVPLTRLSLNLPVDVRFIEEMPFNGSERKNNDDWNHIKILEEIQKVFPSITPVISSKNSTSQQYSIPGAKGRIGIIAAYSRTFCGSCNRLRINATGQLRTCLYGRNELDLRHLIREGSSDEQVISAIRQSIQNRAVDGFEAEKRKNQIKLNESMSKIGG